MNSSININQGSCKRVISRYPALYGACCVVLCIAVYSFLSQTGARSPLASSAAATAIASIAYAICRSTYWANPSPADNLESAEDRLSRTWSSRALAFGAIAAAIAAMAIGLLLCPAETNPDDVALGSPIFFVAVCALTGTYEELLFRGVLFGALKRYYRSTLQYDSTPSSALNDPAIIVQAAIFALLHILSGLGEIAQHPDAVSVIQLILWFAGTFAFGIVMAALLENAHHIALNCALHALYDFALFAPLAFAANVLRSEAITGNPSDLAVFAVQVCILALALAAPPIKEKLKAKSE